MDSFKPRNTLPIGASRNAEEYLSLIEGGLGRDSVPFISSGGSTSVDALDREKTNPFGINIADVDDCEEEDKEDSDRFADKEPNTERGIGNGTSSGTIRPEANTASQADATTHSEPAASDREPSDMDDEDDEFNDTTQVTGPPVVTGSVQMVGDPDVHSSYPPSGVPEEDSTEDLAVTQQQQATPSPKTARGGYSLTGDDVDQDEEPTVVICGPDQRVPKSERPNPTKLESIRPEPVAIPMGSDFDDEDTDDDGEKVTSVSEPPPELVAESIPPESIGDESPAEPQIPPDAPIPEVEGPEIEVSEGMQSKKEEAKPVSEPPAATAPSNPPAASVPSEPPAPMEDDTVPFSQNLVRGSVFPTGQSVGPSQPPTVTVHKMDSVPPAPSPEPPAVAPEPAKAKTIPEPKEPTKDQRDSRNTATLPPQATTEEQEPEVDSSKTPTEEPPESTPETTRKTTRSSLWTALAAVAGITVAGGAIYGGYSAYNNSQNAETRTVAANSANTAPTTTTPPPTTPASTAETTSGKTEITPETAAQKRTYRIDTFHPDFQRYMKSLNGAGATISASKNIARNLNVELNGNETEFEKQLITYKAFLEQGLEKYRGSPGVTGILSAWKRIFKNFMTATKDMSDEQKMEYLEKRTECKIIRPHILFAANRVETTPPEGVSGFTVEMDPTKNKAMATFLINYKKQASGLYPLLVKVYKGIAAKPLKSDRYDEKVAEFMERARVEARAARVANPEDGSLFVLGQIDTYYIQKGHPNIILEPLRTTNPVIDESQNSGSNKAVHPVTPTTGSIPNPSHTYNSPLNNPTQIKPNPFRPFDVDSLDNGWDSPAPAEPQRVAQNATPTAPTLSSLRSHSTVNRPRTKQDAKQMVRDMAAQLSTHGPGMKLAPTMPLTQRSTVANNAPVRRPTAQPTVTKPSAAPQQQFNQTEQNFFRTGEQISAQHQKEDRENREFMARHPEYYPHQLPPKQTVGQKIAGYANRAISYVKKVFSGTPPTPQQQEQRELRAAIPKKSFLRNLFG